MNTITGDNAQNLRIAEWVAMLKAKSMEAAEYGNYSSFDPAQMYSGLVCYTDKNADLYEDNCPEHVINEAIFLIAHALPMEYREKVHWIQLPGSHEDIMKSPAYLGWRYTPNENYVLRGTH